MDIFPKYYPKKNNFVSEKMFKDFRKKYPEYKDLSDTKLRSVFNKFCEGIVDAVIENRDGVALPNHLGNIFIGKCYMPMRKVKAKNFYKNGEPVVYSNLETDNRLMKIFFESKSSKFPLPHRVIWVFKFNQTSKRKISAEFKKNHRKYIEVEGTIKINTLFDQRKKIPKKDKYNELEI